MVWAFVAAFKCFSLSASERSCCSSGVSWVLVTVNLPLITRVEGEGGSLLGGVPGVGGSTLSWGLLVVEEEEVLGNLSMVEVDLADSRRLIRAGGSMVGGMGGGGGGEVCSGATVTVLMSSTLLVFMLSILCINCWRNLSKSLNFSALTLSLTGGGGGGGVGLLLRSNLGGCSEFWGCGDFSPSSSSSSLHWERRRRSVKGIR